MRDGVSIQCLPFRKFRPHSKISRREIMKLTDVLLNDFTQNWRPDVITAHWAEPQLLVLSKLKEHLTIPSCLVFHNNRFRLEKFYGEDTGRLLSNLDMYGFRSEGARADFISKYGEGRKTFIASSGVAESFLKKGKSSYKTFDSPIKSFIFVGSLIERKFPSTIVEALNKVYPDGGYKITFVGDGEEKQKIEENLFPKTKGEIIFTGRIPREEIMSYLEEADFFVMVSKGEIFGLVYLEAMAFGLIPIGSRGQGIDGIIKDGENGFLSKPGDVDELCSVLKRLDDMSTDELRRLSSNAKATASQYSDEAVAQIYLDNLVYIVKEASSAIGES